MKKNIFVVSLLIIIAAISRFLPHGYNFTPVAGMALLGAAFFNKKTLAFIVPIVLLFATDVILNNTLYRVFFPDQEGFVFLTKFMIYTYSATALMVLLGIGLLKKISGPRILGSALGASLVFFLVTNFGAWLGNPLYPQNFGGLLASYTAGLPFLSGHLLGNVVFSFLLFSAYEVITKKDLGSVFRLA